MNNKAAILIPARYASTRFPGKPLAMLGDKTMVETVYEKCKATGFDTYVLTDDDRVAELFPRENCWVDYDQSIENGTERCAAALNDSRFDDYDLFINVQGDMPDVTEEMINKCMWNLGQYQVSTVATMMPEVEQNNPNSVKLIRSENGKCLWFGRGITGYGDWHLGVYGYTRKALKKYDDLTITKEENIEKLEQLRWLKNGIDIGVSIAAFKGIEINTEEDLAKWQQTHLN